jgi:hypothetical protein
MLVPFVESLIHLQEEVPTGEGDGATETAEDIEVAVEIGPEPMAATDGGTAEGA